MNTVGSSLEVNEVVKRALTEIVRITAPDVSFFYLKANEKMLLKEIWKKHRSPLLPEIKDVGVCLCGLAVRKGEAFYSKNIHKDPRCTLDECKQAGVKSFAALPLCGYSGMLGVLSLASFKERDFSQQSAFLEILASHIAISLQNAFLHEESERYASDLEQQIEQRSKAEDTLRRHQRELTKRVRELEEYYAIAIGRELRIKELSEQIEALKVQLEKQKL
jgi:GAF domain-containing protein